MREEDGERREDAQARECKQVIVDRCARFAERHAGAWHGAMMAARHGGIRALPDGRVDLARLA
jgi:hypothetical protein